RDRWWDEAVEAAASEGRHADAPASTPSAPSTPYMLIYTSGTTGRPKGAVHVHGGFPIKAAEDLAHTFDLRRGDGLFWSLVARHRITHLGLSPTVVRALIPHGADPVRSQDLASLRILGSTGEPW